MEENCVLKQSFLKIQLRADEFCLNMIIARKEMLFIFSVNQLRKKMFKLEVTCISSTFFR